MLQLEPGVLQQVQLLLEALGVVFEAVQGVFHPHDRLGQVVRDGKGYGGVGFRHQISPSFLRLASIIIARTTARSPGGRRR